MKIFNLMKKYYFFSATFHNNGISQTQNFGTVKSFIPSMMNLKNIVIEYNEDVKNIVILSICKVSRKQYLKLFFED